MNILGGLYGGPKSPLAQIHGVISVTPAGEPAPALAQRFGRPPHHEDIPMLPGTWIWNKELFQRDEVDNCLVFKELPHNVKIVSCLNVKS